MPLPKFSLQFTFSWSVYFSNRTESYSSQIEFAGPHGITENQATYLHCGGEARAKKRARPPAKYRKASTGKTGADTGPEGCISHFKQNYWQEEISYLIFGRSRPWSARSIIIDMFDSISHHSSINGHSYQLADHNVVNSRYGTVHLY